MKLTAIASPWALLRHQVPKEMNQICWHSVLLNKGITVLKVNIRFKLQLPLLAEPPLHKDLSSPGY